VIRASVIVPTRDRARSLARCLESLTRQTLSTTQFEVIVVNNGSRDDTADVAAGYSTRLNLRCVAAHEPGLHVGRHVGFREARSEVLMYADDDIEAAPTWVESVANAFADPRVGLVGGNNYPKFECPAPDWLDLWWSRQVHKGRALGYLSILDFGIGRFPLEPAYVWGCNFSVRRRALEEAGGFHPDSLPRELLRMRGDGETHVANAVSRRGWTILFDSGASVHHCVSAERMTASYFEQRAYAQGITDSYVAVRSRGGFPLSLRQRFWASLRPALSGLRHRWRDRSVDEGSAGQVLMKVRLAALRAWREGYGFHQAAVRNDPTLLQWILKEHYFS
jgi:glucosyl-dolichyl phosphate glucuronosyltransferase